MILSSFPIRFHPSIIVSSNICVEGNIAFYASAYNRSQHSTVYSISRPTAVQRICVDITEPVVVNTMSNVSTVIFNGAPYEAPVPTGDVKNITPIGFELEAFVVCGGTLHASSTRKLFHLTGHLQKRATTSGCHLRIERDATTDPQSPIYAHFQLLAKSVNIQNESSATVLYRCGENNNDL